MDPHILSDPDPDPGSKNVADPTDPHHKDWLKVDLNLTYKKAKICKASESKFVNLKHQDSISVSG